MEKFLRFLTCLVVCFIPGVLGSLPTFESIENWYAVLNAPSFTPPNWVFSPVWSLLYLLMAVSLYRVTVKQTAASGRAASFFGVHLLLNVLWSYVFFGLQDIEGGVSVIAVLWLMIVGTIALYWKVDKVAAALQVPYLAWVSFASALNIGFYLLN